MDDKPKEPLKPQNDGRKDDDRQDTAERLRFIRRESEKRTVEHRKGIHRKR